MCVIIDGPPKKYKMIDLCLLAAILSVFLIKIIENFHSCKQEKLKCIPDSRDHYYCPLLSALVSTDASSSPVVLRLRWWAQVGGINLSEHN